MSPEETIWEDALHPREEDDDDDALTIDLPTSTSTTHNTYPRHRPTPTWLDDEHSPVRALDMSEQNYEEQAAAGPSSTTAPASQPQGGENEEEEEDTFHIDLD